MLGMTFLLRILRMLRSNETPQCCLFSQRERPSNLTFHARGMEELIEHGWLLEISQINWQYSKMCIKALAYLWEKDLFVKT